MLYIKLTVAAPVPQLPLKCTRYTLVGAIRLIVMVAAPDTSLM